MESWVHWKFLKLVVNIEFESVIILSKRIFNTEFPDKLHQSFKE
jgi:hypothetical protein